MANTNRFKKIGVKKKISLVIIFLLIYFNRNNEVLAAETSYINKIFIESQEVFQKTDEDWFFASPLLNFFHSTTREYLIQDEFLFSEGDLISEDLFLEAERNLRSTELFSKVRIELEEVSDDLYDVYVVSKDRWSLYPSVLFGVTGQDMQYGFRIQEFNLLGTGTYICASGLYRQELSIGLEGLFELKNRRIFRSELSLDFSILANSYYTEQNLILAKPYRTFNTNSAYGVSASNNFGKEIFINKPYYLVKSYPYIDTMQFLPKDEKIVSAWYSRAWLWNDHVYLTALLEYNSTDRHDSVFQRAYDNQGKILFGFSSSAQNFYAVERTNNYSIEDLTSGGWGSVILGKTFPLVSGGIRIDEETSTTSTKNNSESGFFYVAGQAEKSYYSNNIYLFAQLTGATSFSNDFAKYTYQEILALAFFRLNNNILFATRINQQAVWNWPRLRQLIIDETRGLRGYNIGEIAGDNRLISNFELRYFPDWRIFMFDISGVLFYDLASVWNQTINISDSKFYSSLGAGFRLHFTKSNNPLHSFRIDFPYNFHTRKFALSLGVSQYFSAFSNHEFRLPKLFGTDFDFK